jgi:polysaccharide export outer membrane protein
MPKAVRLAAIDPGSASAPSDGAPPFPRERAIANTADGQKAHAGDRAGAAGIRPGGFHGLRSGGDFRGVALTRTSRRFTSLASTMLAVLTFAVPSLADDAPAVPREADVRAAIAGSGMSVDELRQRLRDAGQSPDAIEAAIAALGRAPRASAPTSPAETRPAAAEPARTRPDSLAPRPAEAGSGGPEPFGFDFFRMSPTTFEPLSFGPVDADYPLGPGDQLALTLWGDDQLSLTLEVNREGLVTLPDVGQVSVQGLTLEEARGRVRASLARAYSGLRPTGQRSTTFLSLSLGQLRTIQVFLLGQVQRPGSYTLSSVSRVLNALYAAGGPTREGSLREVRILRGGQVVTSVDLYDVILGGDASRVARLQNGDVVFVPIATRRAQVCGPVRRPGLYELVADQQLAALLQLAGGPLPEADLAHAQIDRVTPAAWRDSLPGQGRVVVDVRPADVLAGGAADAPVLDDDVVTLFALPERVANQVEARGRGVVRPGRYEYRTGMRAADLLAMAGGLKSDAYVENALIQRTQPDSSRASVRFSPAGALRGVPEENVELRPLDVVTLQSVWDLKERQQVSVHGNVRSPGTYELLDGMTLADLLMRAGGFTDDADPQRAEVARISPRALASATVLAETLEVALDRDLARATAAREFVLQPHDAVFLRRDPNYVEPTFVTLEGEVRYPGTYALLRRDERVADLVRRAGGLTEFAYAEGATFQRQGHTLSMDLPRALRRERDAHNLIALPGDVLQVPRFTPSVQVEGAVLTPVTALWRHGAGVGYYVTQASGYRPDADRRGAVVIAPNGHVHRHGNPEPGSRIVVPARPPEENHDHLKDFATLMSVLASMATTIYLVKQTGK